MQGIRLRLCHVVTALALLTAGGRAGTQEPIDPLETFASYGVSTVSVFFMGSRFGDMKGYRAEYRRYTPPSTDTK